jgi:hypothetical protein
MDGKIIPITHLDLKLFQLPKSSYIPNLKGNQSESWALVHKSEILALCSVWMDESVKYLKFRTGVLGHFFAQNTVSGQAILSHGLQVLTSKGFEYAIGPMNGSTWYSYRAIKDQGDVPPFFMEYFTPEFWPEIFNLSGFEEIASYSSARANQILYEDPSIVKFEQKKANLGLIVRNFDLKNARRDLSAIHSLSINSFSNNFLYTDISLEDFLVLNEKVLPFIDPDLFLLAEHNGSLVGFVFAIPDILCNPNSESGRSVIVKTVAKISDRAYAGLGNYLVYSVHQVAGRKGYRSVIHALMHDQNGSVNISDKSAKTIRRYALFGKRLKP